LDPVYTLVTDLCLLAIRIGNTNIGLGVFRGSNLCATWRIETRAERTADEYASDIAELFEGSDMPLGQIEDVAICSVVPVLTSTFEEVCRRYLHLEAFVVGPGVHSGIRIKYEDPRALGSDRLAAMVAAKARYGTPALVVDVGTATTIKALNEAGDFVGGAIAPGPNIQAEALHQFTAKLPRVEVGPPDRALGTNTRDALRSGLFFGYVGLVEELVTRIASEMGPPAPHVIATGGLASLVAPYCPSIDIVDRELAFEGLRILNEMNRNTRKDL
jgi:type III pantothenate kinase